MKIFLIEEGWRRVGEGKEEEKRFLSHFGSLAEVGMRSSATLANPQVVVPLQPRQSLPCSFPTWGGPVSSKRLGCKVRAPEAGSGWLL